MTHRLMYYDGRRPQAHIANLVVDTVNERVGIGTTNPASIFEIRDAADQINAAIFGGQNGKDMLRLVRNSTEGDPTTSVLGQIGFNVANSHPQMYFNEGAKDFALGVMNSPDGAFRIASNDTIGTGTDDRLVIKQTGEVGIGTTDPEVRLHVKGSGGDGRIMIESQGQPRLDFKSSQYGSGPGANVNLLTQNLAGFGNCFSIRRFGTGPGKINVSMDENSNNILNINKSNVGIGTLNPVNPLDVTITVPANISGPEANSFPLASFRALQTGTADQRGLEIGAPPGGIAEAPVYLKVRGTSARFAILNDSNVENFTSKYDGAIGIGTTDPQRLLHIRQTRPTDTGAVSSTTMLALHNFRPESNINQYESVISFRNPAYTGDIISNEFLEVSAIQHKMLNSNTDTDGGIHTAMSFYTHDNGSMKPWLSIIGSNVAIGNSLLFSPNEELHIRNQNDGGDVGMRIQNSTTTAGSTATLYFTATTDDAFNSAFVGTDRNNSLLLGADQYGRITIQNDGNTKVSYNPGSGNIYFQDVNNGASMFYIQPAVYTGSVPFNYNTLNCANSSHFKVVAGSADRFEVKSDGNIIMPTLPTSSTGLPSGALWNDGGTLKIVT